MEPSELKTGALVEDAVEILKELQRRAEFRFEVFEHVINHRRLIHVKMLYQLWLHGSMWLYPQELKRLTKLSRSAVYRALTDLKEDGFIEEQNDRVRLCVQPDTKTP